MVSQRFLHIVFCGVMLAAVSGCTGGEHEKSTAPPLPAAQVKVFAVADQQSVRALQVAGSVEAVEQAMLAAKLPGAIQNIPVELGAQVKKGQLLVSISAPEMEARLAQAQVGLGQARRNFERETRLLAKDASTREGVKLQEEAMLVAEAGVREASGMLANARIVAPFDGVVTRKLVKVGDLATPGLPLLEVANPARLQVVASVPEGIALGLKRGDALPVVVPAAGVTTNGVVEQLAPAADPATRGSQLKLRIEGAPALRTGQYAQVTLSGVASPAILVPSTAVHRFGQMEQLYVVQNDIARLRLVRTGEQHGGLVEIVSGLGAGEKVVVEGGRLADGQAVRITP